MPDSERKPMEARFYEPVPGEDRVRCLLCPHRCVIRPGRTGICRVRENQGGRLYSLSYGEITSIAFDPVEKKPLYHYYPGKTVLSVGSFGCNMRCAFCQNYSISQGRPPTLPMDPERLAAMAAADPHCIGVAYTYNEPITFLEFVQDTSIFVHERKQKNVLVTNGYITPEALSSLRGLIDAANIDIKSFREPFYRDLCGASLAPVLDTVKEMASWCHVEITTLVIPGQNDSEEEIRDIARWIAGISRTIPFHLSRYFPRFQMQEPSTSPQVIRQFAAVAMESLEYVYVGNMP